MESIALNNNGSIVGRRCYLIVFLIGLFRSPYMTSFGLYIPDPYTSRPYDFHDLLSAGFPFVDKSLFIEEYLRHPDRVLLITRPRRWGKSMNMEMLIRFLEIELDADDMPILSEESINHKLFVGGSMKLYTGMKTELKPLKISGCAYCMEHQGRYPIIYLNLDSVVGVTADKVLYHFQKEIEGLYLEHYYLERYARKTPRKVNVNGTGDDVGNDETDDGDFLTTDEKDKLHNYHIGKFTVEDIGISLRFLSELLYKYYRRKVHLFIDQFDTPINTLYFDLVKKMEGNSGNKSEPQILNNLFRDKQFTDALKVFQDVFRNVLVNNSALDKALITGVMKLHRGDVFDGMDAVVRHYGVLDKEFAEYYGFTQTEVDGLLNVTGLQRIREQMKDWYRGYTYGRQDVAVNEKGAITRHRSTMYNPWSVMKCLLREGQLSTYWADSCPMGVRDDALIQCQMQKQLTKLVDGKTVNATVTKAVILDRGLRGGDLYSILLLNGFLTPVSVRPAAEEGVRDGVQKYHCELAIPNGEIRSIFSEQKKELEAECRR